jgi:hypothetical protein
LLLAFVGLAFAGLSACSNDTTTADEGGDPAAERVVEAQPASDQGFLTGPLSKWPNLCALTPCTSPVSSTTTTVGEPIVPATVPPVPPTSPPDPCAINPLQCGPSRIDQPLDDQPRDGAGTTDPGSNDSSDDNPYATGPGTPIGPIDSPG